MVYNGVLDYEWDEAKRSETLVDRGVDFASMEFFEWGTAIVERDLRHTDEVRFITTGIILDRLHVAVYTYCGEIVRIISLRKANAREVRKYGQQD